MCKKPGCLNKPKVRGHCIKHWKELTPIRIWRYPPEATCSAEGCSQKPMAKGLCGLHYDRVPKRVAYRHQAFKDRKARLEADPHQPLCIVDGCSRKGIRNVTNIGWVCWSHRVYLLPSRFSLYSPQGLRSLLGDSCSLCGYNRLRPHLHRLAPAKGYILGNLVPLCANCHREVHAGVMTIPDSVIKVQC